MKTGSRFFKTLRYFCLVSVIALGLITIVGTGGGGGDDGGGANSTTSNGDSGGDTTGKAEWTYMVYITGDNNLSSAAMGDINEMEQVGSSSDVNIVVQVEFSRQYSPDIDMSHNTLRGKIERDYNQEKINSELEDIGNKDMGNKTTLTEFIKWVATNYPANHYALVLWDHGAGWKVSRSTGGVIRGALHDATSGNFMSLPDLASAVSDSGIHMDLINFDACLMAMYEIAYEFNGLTDYMVFSEEVEPGEGDPYDTILQDLVNNPGMTAKNLAKTITSKFKAFYQWQSRTYVTKSAVDMTKTAELHDKIGELVQLMTDNMMSERPNIQSARDDSIAYYYPENRDLGDFLTKLYSASSNSDIRSKIIDIQNTLFPRLSPMVISNEIYSPYHGDPITGSKGLAIFLPRRDQVTDADLRTYAELAININQSRVVAGNSWGNFVNLLVEGDTAAGMSTLETAEGNFVVVLKWDTDADLDLIIWEADGSWAAPYLGTNSANGFLSEDSADSGESVEYYAAAETVQKGRYDIFVNYHKNGSTDDYANAELLFLDPVNGINVFTPLGTKYMDLGNTAPTNWIDNEDERNNVWNDEYSDWWWWYSPDYLTRSLKREVALNSSNETITMGNIRIHFVSLPSKEKVKRFPYMDEDTVEIIKQQTQEHWK